MFVRIFKTGYVFHAVSILIIALLFWIPSVLEQHQIVDNSSSTLLYNVLVSIIDSNYYLGLLVSFLVVSVSGFILNRTIAINDLADKNTMLGLFFFVLLSVSLSSNILMNKLLMASLFLVLMVNALFKLPKGEATIPITFNASFYLGVASLFYYPLVLLIGFIWVSLLTCRIGSWREYVVAFVGVSIPIFFTFFWYFYNDLFYVFYENLVNAFNLDLRFVQISILEIIIVILLIGIIIPSILKMGSSLMEKNIAVRQKLSMVIWLFVFICVTIFFFEKHHVLGGLLIVPSTIILANITNGVKKLKWVDFYISLLFVLILINHYSILFNA